MRLQRSSQLLPNGPSLSWFIAIFIVLLVVASCTPPAVEEHNTGAATRIDGGADEPNPFSPTSSLAWVVPDTCLVTILIYSVTGQVVDTVANEVQQPGRHNKTWDPHGYPSGVYFSKCTICGTTTTKKLVFLK